MPHARQSRPDSSAMPLCLLLLTMGAAQITGCLDPLVDDEVRPLFASDLILPAGAEVPAAEEAAALAAQLRRADGVDGPVVPLISAFQGGKVVRYWDFGPTTDRVAGVYVLARGGPEGPEPVADHPPVFDTIPGEPGYSPFWQMSWVIVSEAWSGQRLPSLAAIQQAKAAGLVSGLQPTPMNVNCPVVASGVALDQGPGREPLQPKTAYYEGSTVRYFDLPPPLSLAGGEELIPAAPLLRLRREGGEPLREPERGVDFTGDGDTSDTNDLLAPGPAGLEATALRRVIEVVLAADAPALDRAGEGQPLGPRSVVELLEATPGGGWAPAPDSDVVALRVTDLLINAPLFQGGAAGDEEAP